VTKKQAVEVSIRKEKQVITIDDYKRKNVTHANKVTAENC